MSSTEIKVYEIFKSRFSEAEAKTVLDYLEEKTEEKYAQKKDILATKQDVSEAKTDIIKWMFIFWIGQVAATVALVKLLH